MLVSRPFWLGAHDGRTAWVYTVTVSRWRDDSDGFDHDVTVVGSADSIAVASESAMSSDTIGDIITVTATVTDEDGNRCSRHDVQARSPSRTIAVCTRSVLAAT